MMPDLPAPDERAGTITEDQRLDLLGVMLRDGNAYSGAYRAEWLLRRIPGWKHAGSIGWLSERQAGDLLAAAAGIGPDESHGGLTAAEAREAWPA